MNTIDLTGDWLLTMVGKKEAIPAKIPGCVHTDLLAAKKIDDPFYRDNEDQQMWIGESNWRYTKTFQVPKNILTNKIIELQCKGLDTFAAIFMNGKSIGKADNQFREWEFNIKPYIHEGENVLEILFESPLPYIKKKQKERFLEIVGGGRMDGGNWIRKEQCQFGWDWGPVCITSGIWKDIKIVAFSEARISDIVFSQNHNKNGVTVSLATTVEKLITSPFIVSASLYLRGELLQEKTVETKTSTLSLQFFLTNPELWWPNGMGSQTLYEVVITLLDKNDNTLDQITKKIGLRTLFLEMKNDQWGQSFQFVVNGKPFFAKGANWIPADAFVSRITTEKYEQLVRSAAEVNMNMLRVWGGGIYEDDTFYDFCDKYGLCVWQDFMFACSAYPAFDTAYLENVKIEIEQNVKRLRHHACLALWCGNNEIEQQWDSLIGNDRKKGQITFAEYKKLFDILIPSVLKKFDPGRSYIPSSPFSPVGNRKDTSNPDYGDAHLWAVWHERQPFEWYWTREDRFNSEFGFQSFPEPLAVSSYTQQEDKNVTSYIMEKHQRSVIGNDAIMQYMIDWFKLPKSFEMTLWLSQILQGMAIKYAVENWRRKKPRGMGTLYWQLNDCWPVASWSSIDYFGNWKALQYMAKRFFSPLLISGVEDKDKLEADIYVTSDLFKNVKGKITWRLTDVFGKQVASASTAVEIPKDVTGKVLHLDLKKLISPDVKRSVLLWFTLVVDGKNVSSNFISFVRPKHLELQKPSFTTTVIKEKNTFTVTITSDKPALWVWTDLENTKAAYSDRFFHLIGGEKQIVIVTPKTDISLKKFDKMLKINSLYNTWES